MPFKSEAQHRKFRVLLDQGKITQSKFDEWMNETKAKHGDKHPIKPLPERVEKTAFWQGFQKRASGTASGSGKGFTGTGKGQNPVGTLDVAGAEGTMNSHGSSQEDTRTNKELLDRERNPRDFKHGETGQNMETPDGRIEY